MGFLEKQKRDEEEIRSLSSIEDLRDLPKMEKEFGGLNFILRRQG